jgi:hypothetical protein
VISASIGADFLMILRESALFSSGCKLISLRVVPCRVPAKASAPQVPWFVLCWWLQNGIRKVMTRSKPIDFYALSRGSFQKPAQNLIETAQRKSQLGVYITEAHLAQEEQAILHEVNDAAKRLGLKFEAFQKPLQVRKHPLEHPFAHCDPQDEDEPELPDGVGPDDIPF